MLIPPDQIVEAYRRHGITPSAFRWNGNGRACATGINMIDRNPKYKERDYILFECTIMEGLGISKSFSGGVTSGFGGEPVPSIPELDCPIDDDYLKGHEYGIACRKAVLEAGYEL